jgi:hypothetical protein
MGSGLNISIIRSTATKFVFSFDHGLDAVIHVLDKGDFRAAESSPVGDVIDVVVRLCVLSMCSSDLDVVLVGDCLEFCLLSSEFWEVDVDGSSQGSAEIGWARGYVAHLW